MEAILKYNMDEPEDQAAHLRAVCSLDMALAINDIMNTLRAKVKYGETHVEVYEDLREEIMDILNIHNVDVDKLLQ